MELPVITLRNSP